MGQPRKKWGGGARVRLTGGRGGGGGISGQNPWRGGGSRHSSCSNGAEGEERSGCGVVEAMGRERGNEDDADDF
jgi:hypothetical protein